MKLVAVVAGLSMLIIGKLSAEQLNIVFTSNLPNIISSSGKAQLSRLAGFLATLDTTNRQNVLLLHGGDSLFPNALSLYDQGAHMIDVLNHMPTNLMFANQSEFALGADNLSVRVSEAGFPVVLSNVIDTRTWGPIEGLHSNYLIHTKNLNVGVFGLVDNSITSNYLISNIQLLDLQNTIDDQVESLAEQGADLTILMSESDLMSELQDLDLSKVDLVLYANSGEDSIDLSTHPISVKSGGHDGEVALIKVDSDLRLKPSIENYSSGPIDLDLQLVVKSYVSQINSMLSQRLLTLKTAWSTKREHIRTQPSLFGAIVADAIRAYLEVDIAIVNSGSIRGDRFYPVGSEVSRLDIRQELPFGSEVYAIEVTRQEIRLIMEHSLYLLPQDKGRFLQIAGMEVEYDSSRPPGERVISLSQNGKALHDQLYTLAVSEYLLNGGDEYSMIAQKQTVTLRPYPRLTWEIVSDYLESSNSVGETSYKLRLVDTK